MAKSIDTLIPSKFRQILSWVIVLIIVGVFLPSLPFKFSGAPETEHIFGTIGLWLSGFLGSGILIYLPGRTLLQAPNGKFADKEKETKTVNKAFEIAAIASDFNNDGALDMVRANLQGQSKVQMNNGHGNNWLSLELPNTAKSLGAVATAKLASGKKLTKHFITSEGLCSDSSHLLYFGLGQEERVTSIDIQYLTGPIQTLTNPDLNKIIKVERPTIVVEVEDEGVE